MAVAAPTVFDWAEDGKVHERFLEWKERIEIACFQMKIKQKGSKEDVQKLIHMHLKVWAGKDGSIQIEKAIAAKMKIKIGEEDVEISGADYETTLVYLETLCKPGGSEIIAAQECKVLRQDARALHEFHQDCVRTIDRMKLEGTAEQIKDKLVRNSFLLGLKNRATYEKLCTQKPEDKTSVECVSIARAFEYMLSQSKCIDSLANDGLNVNKIGTRKPRNFRSPQREQAGGTQKCYRCGRNGICKKEECPAVGKECNVCKKMGHYGRVCGKFGKPSGGSPWKKPGNKEHEKIYLIDQSYEEPDEDIHGHHICVVKSIGAKVQRDAHIMDMFFSIPGQEAEVFRLPAEIDSGAGCNVMPKYVFDELHAAALLKSNVRIRAYGNQHVTVHGECLVDIIAGEMRYREKFVVAEATGHLILGLQASIRLGYLSLKEVQPPSDPKERDGAKEIRFVKEIDASPTEETCPIDEVPANMAHKVNVYMVDPAEKEDLKTETEIKIPDCKLKGNRVIANGKEHALPLTKEYILDEYRDVFEGIGTLPGGKYSITMRKDAKPVQHAARVVPEKKKPAYKKELLRLMRLGIITPVTEHTPWINSIVPATKANGEIRLCLDPKDLNEQMERNPVYSKTVAEVQAELGRTKPRWFTLLDAKCGFWMVLLTLASSYLTTFNTPWGKFRWLRLPFGLKISGDVFQERLDAVVKHITGVSNIVDDCLAHGQEENDHDLALISLLEAARMNGIKFNADKMQFKAKNCKFFGEILTELGMKIDEEKVEALQKMNAPGTKAQLQSFLGMVNYLKRYTPVLSEVTTPLRELVKDDVVYQWEARHEAAFQQIKKVLTSTPVLAYFDARKSHVIQTDASEKGLGGVLLQEGRPVMYISRSLTPTETNYSNIERELLSLVFGMERLHNFVYGGKTLVQTDHKPLESIFKKAVSETTPRLQRLMLRLHRYDIQVEYLKGKENVIADALSRVSPLPPSQDDMEHTDLVPINHLEEMQERGTDSTKKIRTETALDPALQQMKLYVTQGWPERIQDCDGAVQPFWTYKEQVSLENGILYKDSRFIVPRAMQPQMLQDLHAAHQGEEKTMSLARTYLFWNGMKADITNMVKTCMTCQKHRPAMQKELLYPHGVPTGPWEKLGMDLFEFQGAHYLLIADYFSKFPIARKLRSMTSAEVIGHCKEVFSEYGVPRTVYTDQGTQFTSAEFKHLAEKYKFSLEHSSPRHPQANGFAEAMVKVVKNLWIKATEAQEDPYLALLYYRATPVKPGLASPAELLMARKIRTLIPVRATLNGDQEKARQAAQVGKDAQKKDFDKRARVYDNMVLYQAVRFQKDPNKGIWTDGTIVQLPTPQQPRTYVVQQDDGSRYQRNETYIKGRILKQVSLTPTEYAQAVAQGMQFVDPAKVVRFSSKVPHTEATVVFPKTAQEAQPKAEQKNATPEPAIPPPGDTRMTRSKTAAENQPRRSPRNKDDQAQR